MTKSLEEAVVDAARAWRDRLAGPEALRIKAEVALEAAVDALKSAADARRCRFPGCPDHDPLGKPGGPLRDVVPTNSG